MSRPWVGMSEYISAGLFPPVSFNWEGQGNLLNCQIKFSIINQYRRSGESYWNSFGLLEEADGHNGAAAGTKALVPHRVQVKEGSGSFTGCHNCCLKNECRLGFVWCKMKTAAPETAAQLALRNCTKMVVGEGQYMWFWWREISVQSGAYFTNGFQLVMRSWCQRMFKLLCYCTHSTCKLDNAQTLSS